MIINSLKYYSSSWTGPPSFRVNLLRPVSGVKMKAGNNLQISPFHKAGVK